jgi:hypothetical protein
MARVDSDTNGPVRRLGGLRAPRAGLRVCGHARALGFGVARALCQIGSINRAEPSFLERIESPDLRTGQCRLASPMAVRVHVVAKWEHARGEHLDSEHQLWSSGGSASSGIRRSRHRCGGSGQRGGRERGRARQEREERQRQLVEPEASANGSFSCRSDSYAVPTVKEDEPPLPGGEGGRRPAMRLRWCAERCWACVCREGAGLL